MWRSSSRGRLNRYRHTLDVFLVVTVLLASCSGAPPGEEALVERFRANQPLFERLARQPDDPALHSRLGMSGVRRLRPELIVFPVWHRDYFGPGGAAMGYAYAAGLPGTLVDSIELSVVPGSSLQTELYRQLDGRWYLYYASAH